MKQVFAGLILTLVSLSAMADQEVIRIFVNDKTPVALDVFVPKTIRVMTYNLDDKKRSEKAISDRLRNDVGIVLQAEMPQAYKNAFSDLLNSTDWQQYANNVQASAANITAAMRFQIKSVPAIVINDVDVIYGVFSLKEALRIYNEKGTFK